MSGSGPLPQFIRHAFNFLLHADQDLAYNRRTPGIRCEVIQLDSKPATFDDELVIGEQPVADARIGARPTIFGGWRPICGCRLHQTDSGTTG